jgi:hypothetical protein
MHVTSAGLSLFNYQVDARSNKHKIHYSVYTAIGICHTFMSTGCWQDRNGSCQQPVDIKSWHIPIAVYTE